MHSLVYSSITVSNLTARPSSVLHVTLHSKLVAQPPGGTHIMAEDSGHGIQIDRPDLVAWAIRQVIEKARNTAHHDWRFALRARAKMLMRSARIHAPMMTFAASGERIDRLHRNVTSPAHF